MDVREKLVELLFKCTPKNIKLEWRGEKIEVAISQGNIADYLIDNGVTVQECGHWEDGHGDYVCSCCHTVFTDDLVWLVRGESNEPNYCPNCGAKMTPQPPKGE